MWSDEQLSRYHQQGFFLSTGLLNPKEISQLNGRVPELLQGCEENDRMHRVYERTGSARSVFTAHRHCEPYREMSRDPRILDPIRQILGSDVYIWHSKINSKAPFEGTVWLWHQDYGYWKFDGVEPRLISVMVFLEEATLNNGCLVVASGSHKWQRQEHFPDSETTNYKQWCITREVLQEKLRDEAICPIIAKPGDVLFFDCNLAHASGHNLSPLARNVWIICYNDIANKPQPVENPRPDWVVSRSYEVVK